MIGFFIIPLVFFVWLLVIMGRAPVKPDPCLCRPCRVQRLKAHGWAA